MNKRTVVFCQKSPVSGPVDARCIVHVGSELARDDQSLTDVNAGHDRVDCDGW